MTVCVFSVIGATAVAVVEKKNSSLFHGSRRLNFDKYIPMWRAR